MSDRDDSSNTFDPLLRPLMDCWTAYARQFSEAAEAVSQRDSATKENDSHGREWLDLASQSIDAYLRSPLFSGLLKSHLNTLIELKQQSATSPYDVVHENCVFRLLHYHANSPRQYAEPVLICFALVNRPYVLDLPNGRSVVQRLLEQGLDVWLVDWVAPTQADHTRRLEDYVCDSMQEAVTPALQHAGCSQLNLLGYCMGGTMATLFTALNPEQIRNLILLAPPIDFESDDGLLNRWSQKEYFDVDRFVDAYGNCPGWFLQSCFQLMKPVQNYIEKYLNLQDKMDSDASLENFLAMERWAGDSIPIAGETFRDFVKLLYQQNQLVDGKLELRGVAVRLDSIHCPVLLLTADRDHLVSPRSSKALKEHIGSAEFKSLSIDAGHVGLAVSSRSHRELWPQASAWIAAHSTEVT